MRYREVLDTTDALYLWEWPPYPQFLIPVGDVDPDALVDEEHVSNLSRGRVARVGLRAGDVVVERVTPAKLAAPLRRALRAAPRG